MFFCRVSVEYLGVHLGYRYHEMNIYLSPMNLPEPFTIADAQSICTAWNPLFTAIDAQIIYSDGSARGFFEGLTIADVVEASWLVLLTWAAVWSVKKMRGR